jgi:regulator of sigma E protease
MSTALAFLGALALLIAVHEYGHYRVAVACGVKVLRFSIGFGRVVWRRQHGETEFVLSMLPLGGYVKMLDAREGEVADHEKHRAFDQQPLWQRSAIVAAGPIANLLLAVLLYAGSHWVGVEEPQALIGTPPAGSLAQRGGMVAGDWVRATSGDSAEAGDDPQPVRSMSDLRWRLTQSALEGRALTLFVSDSQGRGERRVRLPLQEMTPGEVDAGLMQKIGLGAVYSPPVIGRVVEGGPAQRAGLVEGDLVLEVEGRVVADAAELRQAIRASQRDGAPTPMPWTVQRGERRLDLSVTPALQGGAGASVARIEAYIGQPPTMVTVRYGVLEGLVEATRKTWEVSALSLKMMFHMLIGEASLKNLTGPITIADFAGQSARLGLAHYLGFLALISVSLGVLNLLPLPMLDGGHLMYHLFEGLTGRPVSVLWLDRLQRGGMAVMLMMMTLALYNDVARLMGQH